MPTPLPSISTVFSSLLRADLITQWRNRRSSILVVLVPVLILISWKPLVEQLGGALVISNCITVGLIAIGLMGYSNSMARDRDKGIFQRLRVAPAPSWSIILSRLVVQLIMIILMATIIFVVGYKYDDITISSGGYAFGMTMAIVGGAVYLSLGQVIVGLIKNPETVSATTRLVYFAFIMVGMFAQFPPFGEKIGDIVKWSPYGAVKSIVAAGLEPTTWNNQTSIALLATLGYTVVFTTLGIRWFRWNAR
jgi:ABC-2 type transport system permease protein